MHTLIHSFKRTIQPQLNTENGVLLIALLIAAGLLWNTMQTLQRNFQLQQRVDVMRQEVELTELENQTLEFQQKYYQSAEYLELSARQRLNRAAPGEKIVLLPAAPVDQKEVARQAAALTQQSNFEQWVEFFFGARDTT